MKDEPQGPSDFITEAYALKGTDSAIEFYRKWARDYDSQMLSKKYSSPQRITRLLDEYVFDYDIAVLDVGCGTGLTGKHVKSTGVTRLDGLDISPEMIEVARSREIYRNLLVADINQDFDIADDSYDAIISSGTFTHGHVGPKPMLEILRVLKPGGLLACTVHFELWHAMKFDAMFATLISSNQIQCLALHEGPYYDNSATEGWYCLYQKQENR